MATVSIELAREYLRVLEGEDDTILSFLIDAAESELKESGVVIEDNESFLSMSGGISARLRPGSGDGEP